MGGRGYAHVGDPKNGLQRRGAKIHTLDTLTHHYEFTVQYAVKDVIPLNHGARTPGLPWECQRLVRTTRGVWPLVVSGLWKTLRSSVE